MPEGPEIFLSAQFVNKISASRLFTGNVTKSEVSWKNPEIDWSYPAYTINAQSRGKEMKLKLRQVLNPPAMDASLDFQKFKLGKSLEILFRFGMSGRFAFTNESEMDKHAHLHFHTRDGSGSGVLSFVDTRRFGRWEISENWSEDRGPCVLREKEAFRDHVLQSLDAVAFNKPICETMLEQKYFNGIGNYLRAEILHRLNIPPFTCARDILEPLRNVNKRETADFLDLCSSVALEVTALSLNCSADLNDTAMEEGAYFKDTAVKERTTFDNWLRCYSVKGMKNMADHNKRTIWFAGQPGPMVPSGQKGKSVGRFTFGKITSYIVESNVDEKTVKKDVDEKTTEKDVDEKTVKKDVDEKTVKKDVDEKTMKKDVDKKTVKKHVDEKAMEKDVDKKAVKKDVNEKNVEEDVDDGDKPTLSKTRVERTGRALKRKLEKLSVVGNDEAVSGRTTVKEKVKVEDDVTARRSQRLQLHNK